MATIYIAFFAVSVAAILAFVYFNTVNLLERQTEETIQAEVRGLADQYRERGLAGVYDIIVRRSDSNNGTLYGLVDKQGDHIAGNLRKMPLKEIADNTWIDFKYLIDQNDATSESTVHAYNVELAGDYDLLVGRNANVLQLYGTLIQETLYGALVLSLILGLGGGYFLSRNFLRRVDKITETSHKIMAGDLSGRMPVAGTGDELDRLSISLNEMLSQIERLMQGMKEVSGNVAHDLKTPMTRMRARIEAALRQDKNSEHREALNQTIEECDSLLRTFNALLSIAKSEAGQIGQKFEILNLHDILADLAELYEPLAEEAGGTLRIEIVSHLNVLGDRQLIAQAVSNLLDNALKYGDGEISLSAYVLDKNIFIIVADHGLGIPIKDRERVLQRFVRLDESRSKPGNGLGLSLVASVVTLHGGKLILQDNEPGLKAILCFPMAL